MIAGTLLRAQPRSIFPHYHSIHLLTPMRVLKQKHNRNDQENIGLTTAKICWTTTKHWQAHQVLKGGKARRLALGAAKTMVRNNLLPAKARSTSKPSFFGLCHVCSICKRRSQSNVQTRRITTFKSKATQLRVNFSFTQPFGASYSRLPRPNCTSI